MDPTPTHLCTCIKLTAHDMRLVKEASMHHQAMPADNQPTRGDSGPAGGSLTLCNFLYLSQVPYLLTSAVVWHLSLCQSIRLYLFRICSMILSSLLPRFLHNQIYLLTLLVSSMRHTTLVETLPTFKTSLTMFPVSLHNPQLPVFRTLSMTFLVLLHYLLSEVPQ